MKTSLVLALALFACGKSKHVENAVACDDSAIKALATKLTAANGLGVDLQDPKVKTDIAAAAKDITAKKFAFTGCKFAMQGNDAVSFSSFTSSELGIECHMKGGEDGVTKFRHEAMAIGQAKLKLDVSGTIAMQGKKPFERLAMTDCEIITHE